MIDLSEVDRTLLLVGEVLHKVVVRVVNQHPTTDPSQKSLQTVVLTTTTLTTTTLTTTTLTTVYIRSIHQYALPPVFPAALTHTPPAFPAALIHTPPVFPAARFSPPTDGLCPELLADLTV